MTLKHGSAGSDKVTIRTTEACIADVHRWMAINFFKLNDDKTEFLFIVSARRSGTVSMADLWIGNSFLSAASSVQNLGATFDSTMSV